MSTQPTVFNPSAFINYAQNPTDDESQLANNLANIFGGHVLDETTTGIDGPGRRDYSVVLPGSGEKLDATDVDRQLSYTTQGRYNADTGEYQREPLWQHMQYIYGDAYRPAPSAPADDWRASGAMTSQMGTRAGAGQEVKGPSDGGPGGGGTLRGGQSALPPGQNNSEGTAAYWPAPLAGAISSAVSGGSSAGSPSTTSPLPGGGSLPTYQPRQLRAASPSSSTTKPGSMMAQSSLASPTSLTSPTSTRLSQFRYNPTRMGGSRAGSPGGMPSGSVYDPALLSGAPRIDAGSRFSRRR